MAKKEVEYKFTPVGLRAIEMGTFELDHSKATKRFGRWFRMTLGVSKDFTMSISVDEDTILANPDWFQQVE